MDLGIFPLLMDNKYQAVGISAAQIANHTGAEHALIGIDSLF